MQSRMVFTSLVLVLSLSWVWADGDNDNKEDKKKVNTPTKITWQMLSKVTMEFVDDGANYVVKFSDEIKALNGKYVKIGGFMVLTAISEDNRNFLLSQVPAGQCFFCGSGGPTSLIEIVQRESVEPTFEMIAVTGKLSVLENDPYGLFYRITDAKVISGIE